MDNLNQNVDFIINSAEVHTETQQIRNDIIGVGESAEQAVERVEQSFRQMTDSQRDGINHVATQIVALETQLEELKKAQREALDPHQVEAYNLQIRATTSEISRLRQGVIRSLDAPGRQFNGLQNSINQLSRELPAFTVSAQTGFLAISNNIPILVDEINRARVANEALTASGQAGVPVFKQLMSSLFSWGTAISLGITLLTVFGKDIVGWISALVKGKEALNSWANMRKLDNQIQQDSIKGYAKEVTQLTILKEVITDHTLSHTRRNAAVVEYNQIADKANQLDKKAIDNTTVIEEAINRQIELIKKRGLARAAEAVIAQKAETVFQKQLELSQKFPAYTDDAIANQDNRAIKAINDQAKKLGIKNVNAKELLAQALLPDAALQQMAAQDNKFSILLDKGTKKIVDEVIARKRQIDAIRKNETGGYAGLATSLDDVDKAKQDLDAATDVGLKYIKDEAPNKAKKEKVDKSIERIADQRKALNEKILELDNEYARKTYTKDQEEIEALKEKFRKVTVIVEAFNKKHPKAAIDLTDFNNIKENAVDDLKAQQELEKSKVGIEQQKQLFAQFEQYKLDFGAQKADQRFSNDLKGYKDYVSYLTSLTPKVDDKSAKANATRDFLTKAIPAAEQEARQKNFDNINKDLKRVLDATQTAKAKELEIEKKYQKDLVSLNADKSLSNEEFSARVDKLDQAKVLELKATKALANQETQYYKDAMKDVTHASLDELKQRIKDAQKELENANLTPEQRAAVKGKLSNAQQALADDGFTIDKYGQVINENAKGVKQAQQISDYAAAASGSFYEMANALKEIAPGTADTLETLGDIAGVAGNAAKSFASFASGDVVGGIQGAVSAVAGVFAIGAKAKASELKAQAEIKAFQDKIFQGEISLNIEMRNRARTQQDINDLTNVELEARQKLLKTQADQAKLDYEKELAQVQAGQQITGYHEEKYGGFLGIGKKTRSVADYADLQGKSYEQLEALSLAGKLDEATEKLFQNLKNSHDEMKAIGDAAGETAELITSKMTGGLTADSITNTIVDGFKNSKRALKDFADDTTDMLSNALLSGLSYQLLSEPLKKLVAQFGEDAKDGLSNDEIANFKAGLGSATQTFLSAADAVEKATGISLSGKTNTNATTAAGVVRAELTEDTGGALLGRINGLYDLEKQSLVVAKSSMQIFVDSQRSLEEIRVHTGNAVVELQNAVAELKDINKNTKGSFGVKF